MMVESFSQMHRRIFAFFFNFQYMQLLVGNYYNICKILEAALVCEVSAQRAWILLALIGGNFLEDVDGIVALHHGSGRVRRVPQVSFHHVCGSPNVSRYLVFVFPSSFLQQPCTGFMMRIRC
ncbi:hypothetical protein O6H91_14G040600 [Diphasiastrum complanatum]|nr:hypothetical protein O6H91_14G040600 [Diphasiastrum complanatum]